jgi:hypothetical protein
MFPFSHHPRTALLMGLVLMALAANQANADGLIGYRNDTNQVIVVQSSIAVGNTVKKSKPQMLYPGEVALDSLTGAGTRHITIHDPKKPNTPLLEEDVNVKNDTFFSVQAEAATMPIKNPPSPPKFKLVQATIPTIPVKPGMSTPMPPTTPPKPPTTNPKKP